MLIVASDRISVFDVVLPDEIPDKGRVLTALSTFWFEQTASIFPNHLVSVRPDRLPRDGRARGRRPGDARAGHPSRSGSSASPAATCSGRRGRSTGERGTVCGRTLPPGLRQAERLPEPIFTSTTKAEAGHDLPLTDAEAAELVGAETFEQVPRRHARDLRVRAPSTRSACGLILADTKFEFGTVDDELLVIDEMLTPDSSRYWPAEDYQVGGSPPSFDKQYVRDYYLRARLGPGAARAAACRARSSRARAPATSRRTSCSPASASTSGTAPSDVASRTVRSATDEVRGAGRRHAPARECSTRRVRRCERSLPALGYAQRERRAHRQDDPPRRRRARRGRGPGPGRRDVPPPPRQPGHRGLRPSTSTELVDA